MDISTINLKHYVAVVAHLCFRACLFAKECAENPSLGKYEKAADDPVTDADYKIQTYLIKGVGHFFPKLRIVGEETVDYKGQIDYDFDKIDLKNYPQECELDQNVPVDELCLWIDPIDNTKGFVKGELEGVTILVGMARKNSAYLGAIARPYFQENGKIQFRPNLKIGYVPKAKAFEVWDKKTWKKLERPMRSAPLTVVSSERKTQQPTVGICQELKAKLLRLGGSGKKINQVIEGDADALLYIKTANCRWDSCAGEAIVKAMGGHFTNTLGQSIDYEANATDYLNNEGNVCVFDEGLFKAIIQQCKQLEKNQKA